jgi:hypothetical protein
VNYIFTQALSDATALTVTTASVFNQILTSFINAIEPPPPHAELTLGEPGTPPGGGPGAGPPGGPPTGGSFPFPGTLPPSFTNPPEGPLADLAGLDADLPSSSDPVVTYVVGSLDGGPPPPNTTAIIIPGYLTSLSAPPAGTLSDTSLLSAFGNSALWQ